MTLDEEELRVREMIASIQREYEKAMKPYIDRLVHLNARRTPSYIVRMEDVPDFLKKLD